MVSGASRRVSVAPAATTGRALGRRRPLYTTTRSPTSRSRLPRRGYNDRVRQAVYACARAPCSEEAGLATVELPGSMNKMTYASVVKKSIGICDESNVKPSDVR